MQLVVKVALTLCNICWLLGLGSLTWAANPNEAYDYYNLARSLENQVPLNSLPNYDEQELGSRLDRYLATVKNYPPHQNDLLDSKDAYPNTLDSRMQRDPLDLVSKTGNDERLAYDIFEPINEPQPLISKPINDPNQFSSIVPSSSNEGTNQSDILNSLVNSILSSLAKELRTGADKNHSNKIGDPLGEKESHGGSEYIDNPLNLVGHQSVQGGAGEGKQLLGPEGSFENIQVIKSDNAVPSYCDPPNPCPIGYTTEDGCLEDFINSASFSREYQVKQKCSCDSEHSLFNCASPVSALTTHSYLRVSTDGYTEQNEDSNLQKNDVEDDSLNQESNYIGNQLDVLSRAIQNRFGNLMSVKNLIADFKSDQ